MWQGMYPSETDQALQARVQFPEPEPAPRASAWAQIGEMAKAPYQGFAQGVNQTLRVGAKAVGLGKTVDDQLRSNVEFWNPDPVASTTASMVLQQGFRLLTKAGGYGLAGGVPGAVAGTALDEGVTGYLEMRDKGVDPATAAQVGVVRGAATGVGIALPVVGGTALRTAGLVALGGPGSFMAEQAVTRDILETAQYPELAQQYDPLDPAGLALSIAIPGVIGAAAHAVRLRKPGATALADSPEHLEAAHVAYREETARAGTLADPGDVVAMGTHTDQVRAAARALEDGQRVEVPETMIDPVRAEAVMRDAGARLEAARPEIEAAAREVGAIRNADMPSPASSAGPQVPDGPAPHLAEPATVVDQHGTPHEAIEAMGREMGVPPEVAQMASDAAEALQRLTAKTQQAAEQAPKRSALAPAEDVIARRPDLPVRLDEASPAGTARDVVERVRAEAAQDRQDSRAFVAAIECALRSGT